MKRLSALFLLDRTMIKITYIFHSSFLVSTPDFNILFDFWKDPENMLPSLIDREKPFYVIVSHHHKDHYTKEIFEWALDFPHIHYILSKDTAQMARHFFSPTSTHRSPKVEPNRLSVLRPGESFHDSNITVAAFGSTDIGNSYLVTTNDGRTIFHAGDLNAWIWKDESTQAEVEEALEQYSYHIGLINKATSFGDSTPGKRHTVDIAFFPVDSRIGTEYWTGAKIFLETFNVIRFFPMHFGLGTPEEQLRHRIDASRYDLYADPRSSTEFIGPLQPYGTVAIQNRDIIH